MTKNLFARVRESAACACAFSLAFCAVLFFWLIGVDTRDLDGNESEGANAWEAD